VPTDIACPRSPCAATAFDELQHLKRALLWLGSFICVALTSCRTSPMADPSISTYESKDKQEINFQIDGQRVLIWFPRSDLTREGLICSDANTLCVALPFGTISLPRSLAVSIREWSFGGLACRVTNPPQSTSTPMAMECYTPDATGKVNFLYTYGTGITAISFSSGSDAANGWNKLLPLTLKSKYGLLK
jgi:hypothetical protein